MDYERVPKPNRSESEERRRRCALMNDIEVEVPTVQVRAEGAGTETRPGARRSHDPNRQLTDFWIFWWCIVCKSEPMTRAASVG